MEPQDLPMPSAATLGSLTDALIENVFALVCAEQMGGGAPVFRPCAALPLVSKRWRHVYVHSTILWESLQMDWSSIMQLYILVAPPTYHIPRCAGCRPAPRRHRPALHWTLHPDLLPGQPLALSASAA